VELRALGKLWVYNGIRAPISLAKDVLREKGKEDRDFSISGERHASTFDNPNYRRFER
jgi:hypothetical protein